MEFVMLVQIVFVHVSTPASLASQPCHATNFLAHPLHVAFPYDKKSTPCLTWWKHRNCPVVALIIFICWINEDLPIIVFSMPSPEWRLILNDHEPWTPHTSHKKKDALNPEHGRGGLDSRGSLTNPYLHQKFCSKIITANSSWISLSSVFWIHRWSVPIIQWAIYHRNYPY